MKQNIVYYLYMSLKVEIHVLVIANRKNLFVVQNNANNTYENRRNSNDNGWIIF